MCKECGKECCKELARAYVPVQKMGEVLSGYEGLKKGTIFPELYKPYEEKEKKGGGGYE